MVKQTQTLIKGTLILTLAGVIAKVISAFYKIPLEHLTGTAGIGYYQYVYPIYSLLTAAGLIGIPNSIAKLVAEEIELKRYKTAHQTFRVAFIITGIIGLLVTLALFGLKEGLIEMNHWPPETVYGIIGLSLSPIFISIAGAVRGYLQGMQNMYPTAMSQIIENISKVVIGIALVYLLLEQGYSIPFAIGGAAFGTSIGFVISALYLCLVYICKRSDIKQKLDQAGAETVESFLAIAKKIGLIAIPVTISSATYSIMATIDSVTIPVLLKDAIPPVNTEIIMGTLGKVQTIVNVPLVISVSLIISVVPSIAQANARADKQNLREKIAEILQMALKLALPAAVGILALSKPLLTLVYREGVGHEYLQLLSISLVFMILAQSINGILQGLSRYYVTFLIVMVSAGGKLLINLWLIGTSLSGLGAIIGTIAYYVLICLIGYYVVRKQTQVRIDVGMCIGKPLISSAIMGVGAYVSYELIHGLVKSNALSTISSVLLGMVLYGGSMILLKGFTMDELMILPYHEKMIGWLRRHKLL